MSMTPRSIEPDLTRGSAKGKSDTFSYPRLLLALGLWLFAGAALVLGCVDTAECDESIRCEDGLICFEYQCATPCYDSADCDEGEICASCVVDDASGTRNRCFGQSGSACTLDVPE